MMRTLRPALTMIELILVIVILGIVSSIGAEIIANVYGGYIVQRAQHRASIKTELAAIEIANRLTHAIPGTVVRRATLTGVVPTDINEPGNSTDAILQWVGSDTDSFNAITSATNRLPGWNGMCDVDASAGSAVISTPGSNLALAGTIIGNLGGTLAGSRLYFPLRSGLQGHEVTSGAGEAITLTAAPARISEHYKLAWTSYALEAKADGDLILHYNFTPTVGADITNQSQALLLRNVSTFEFRGDGETIRFKLCVQERIGDGNITICKEKAVF